MTDLRTVLAFNMKERRRALKISQAKLAELAGTADNYIALIETGRRFPSLAMLEKIAVALSIDAPALFATAPLAAAHNKTLKTQILVDIEKVLAARLDTGE